MKLRLYSKPYLFFFFLSTLFINAQTTFTYTGNGLWTDEVNWSPSYPGTTINSEDAAILQGIITLNVNVINNGTFTNDDILSLTPAATLTNNGMLVNSAQATISGGIGTLENEGTFINDGNISTIGFITNSGMLTNAGTLFNGGLFVNYELATLFNTPTGTFDNDESFTNYGFLNNEGRITNDGFLENIGNIFGANVGHEEDFSNIGILSPGNAIGTYAFGSDYIHQSAARLDIQLESATSFDRVTILETVELDGTLDISLYNGFSPSVNDSFTILTAGTITGTFTTLNLPEGYNWEITYTATEVILEVAETLSVLDSEQLSFNMYPNPTRDQFSIQLNDASALEQLTIYNALGQEILTTKASFVNTSKLTSGAYFVEISTNTGKSSKTLIID